MIPEKLFSVRNKGHCLCNLVSNSDLIQSLPLFRVTCINFAYDCVSISVQFIVQSTVCQCNDISSLTESHFIREEICAICMPYVCMQYAKHLNPSFSIPEHQLYADLSMGTRNYARFEEDFARMIVNYGVCRWKYDRPLFFQFGFRSLWKFNKFKNY